MNRHTRVRRKRKIGDKTNIGNKYKKNKLNRTKKRVTGGDVNDLIDASTKDTEDMIKNAKLAANLTKLGHGVIIGLTISGVGIPFVGLVGAVFLISNALLKAKENNLTLKNVLNDVLVIITNNFRLYKG